MNDLLAVLIPGLFTVLVAVVEVRGQRDRKKAAANYERRAEESRLSMQLMSASCKLGVVTAKAVTNQHVNGDVEQAMEAAAKAQDEYESFIRRLAGQQAAKV